jgi:hypothetical protein
MIQGIVANVIEAGYMAVVINQSASQLPTARVINFYEPQDTMAAIHEIVK